MPRENRKRGKKHKKQPEEQEQTYHVQPPQAIEPEPTEKPSWIVSNPAAEFNPEAPFGYVDNDVKAYFRTVDVQIRQWQDNQEDVVEEEDVDPNEQKRMFFMAALTEMQDKEKMLATDPDCSVILERMSYSMDDFVRRVFVDKLAGSYEVLLRHRFASHVCQTLFTVAKETISRETRGILPVIPESEETGVLPKLTQLVLDVCEELLPTFPSLIMDPFASHVVRALLLLLSPNLSNSEETTVRSKKSANWKARQGQMKSVFNDEKGKGKEITKMVSPPEFKEMARRLVNAVREQLDDNEVRAMAANKVACPGLQMLLQVEADQDMANESGSLMDRVMVGIITACQKEPIPDIEDSDYLGTLLRDPTASHLLETVVSQCPDVAFNVFWNTYFKGKLARLAAHPVANFVLAKAAERSSEDQLAQLFEELKDSASKLIRTSRTGVLRALVDRTATLKYSKASISETIYSAFDITEDADKNKVVSCILTLLPLPEYQAAIANGKTEKAAPQHHGSRHQPSVPGPLEPKIQGSTLLQALLRLPEPTNQFVIDSIFSLSIEDRIKVAHNPAGSRVFDALLDSPTVPSKVKRQFVMDFIGHYHQLVDDKLGSRVGDRCWAFCDTYLKEKIARSLIPQEQALAASFYGKFFARNLNLYLLQRRPQDWRNMQSDRKRAQEAAQTQQQPAPTPSAPPDPAPAAGKAEAPQPQPENRKRKHRPDNEIDALFEEKLGKKIKKAALADGPGAAPTELSPSKPSKRVKGGEDKKQDKELQQILGAIRSAPANDKMKH
ncbi:ARM repeat-containing protein [Agrocybe pediades]|nr:ARM repeat-containing protein [Agrocybe pediades]